MKINAKISISRSSVNGAPMVRITVKVALMVMIRVVKPSLSEWYESHGIDVFDAGQNFWDEMYDSLPRVCWTHNGARYYFALIEAEGGETFFVREIVHGIWRAGGVRPLNAARSLRGVAERLEWADPPEDLVGVGWDREESIDEAHQRFWRRP